MALPRVFTFIHFLCVPGCLFLIVKQQIWYKIAVHYIYTVVHKTVQYLVVAKVCHSSVYAISVSEALSLLRMFIGGVVRGWGTLGGVKRGWEMFVGQQLSHGLLMTEHGRAVHPFPLLCI